MSPIDNHLREALSRHAGDVPEELDWFTAVERRARTIHRRRIALVSGTTAIVLAGGVVGGLALTGSDRDTLQTPPLGNSGTPAPSPSPSTTSGPTVPDGRYLDWPYRFQPGSPELDVPSAWHVLWSGELPTGTSVLIRQDADAAGNIRAVARITEPGLAPYTVEGAAIKPDVTTQVSFVLPGDAYPFVLVIGAPTTGQIEYAADGTSYEPVETIDGWALFKRTGPGPGSTDGDRIRVLDGNGDLDHPLYEGPIDTGPSEPDV